MKGFDSYELKARYVPGVATATPVLFLLLVYFVDVHELLSALITMSGVGVVSAVIGAQIARSRGLKVQEKLFRSWGGVPSVILLRHRDSTIDSVSKGRYHQMLSRGLGIPMPDREKEKTAPEIADEVYWSCSRYLNKMTKAGAQHIQVRAENANYGLRRNMLGMKPLGAASAAVSFVVVVATTSFGYHDGDSARLAMIAGAGFVSAGLLQTWLFIVRPHWVKESAYRYATSVIEACDAIDYGGKNVDGAQ